MLRTILFALIAIRILTFISAVYYHQLYASMPSSVVPKRGFSPSTSHYLRLAMWLLGLGYLCVGTEILSSDQAQPNFFVICVTLFFVADVVYFLMQAQHSNLETLQRIGEEQQYVLHQAEEHNQTLRTQVDLHMKDLQHKERLLRTVNEAATILLASSVEDFADTLQQCMGMLADSVQVDRIGIWRNTRIQGELHYTLVQEWAKGIKPLMNSGSILKKPYATTVPSWESTLASGQSINTLVRTLSSEEQRLLLPLGIVSMLILPVILQDQFWGFVGFDDCQNERVFTDVEEGIMQSGSLLMANALMSNEVSRDLVQAREDALASTKAKSTFLANMSHEIRTPINAITGMATIARGTDDMVRIRDCLAKIDAASRQLLGIINDILDLSKIEASKMEFASEPFELTSTMYNIQSIIGVRVTEKKQHFTLNIASDVPSVVIGDDMRLSQILINLLSNAVKFTPEEGNISLSLRLLRTEGDTHFLEARVQDDGIGISPEQQNRLFRSFEQADISTSKQYGGSGLGLVISKRIAEHMNGTIILESELNKGSCFTVQFCLKAGDKSMLKQLNPVLNYNFQGCSVLLAEDIHINQEIVVALLEEYGVHVECADNGQIAVEQFMASPDQYDIIFMDVHMPIMDGYTATRAIRSSGIPRAHSIPILAMTANAFAEDVAEAHSAGMSDHIAKPVELEILLAKMADLLPNYCTE